MFSIIFYKIFSVLAYVFTTFWLGIFIVPFLGVFVMKFIKHTKKDTLQKITEPIGLKKFVIAFQTLVFTLFLYAFLTIGTIELRDMFANNTHRNDFKELLQKVSKSENFYMDGKWIKKPKQIIDDLLKVEPRSSHRTKDGHLSSGTGAKKFHIFFGRHSIKLHQDNAKEQEYWVYFDNDYVGRMDTYYFMSKEEKRRIKKELEAKNNIREENIDNNKSAFILFFILILIALFLHENILKSKKIKSKTKLIVWRIFILISAAIYYLFINKVFFFNPFIIGTILLYSFITISFCKKCGKVNHKKIVTLEKQNCSKCGESILGVFEKDRLDEYD